MPAGPLGAAEFERLYRAGAALDFRRALALAGQDDLNLAPGGRTVGEAMKFHASVVFEFSARDVGEAGERLNKLLVHAADQRMETRSLELSTPPGTPVTLPSISPAPIRATPGPAD